MRKMGFKVYQKYFNRMLPIRSISFDKYGNIEDITVDNRGMNGKYNVIPVFSTYRKESDFDLEALEILQSTGITDKNGTKIFEGDIIKYQVFSNWKKKCGLDDARNIGIVFYNTDKASFYIRMVKKVFVSDYYYIGENDPLSITCALWGLEIIGNIYDNPELLK